MVRHFLTVHVFGSRGCGKTTFKTHWFESSQARAISEIADVYIHVQVGKASSPDWVGVYPIWASTFLGAELINWRISFVLDRCGGLGRCMVCSVRSGCVI